MEGLSEQEAKRRLKIYGKNTIHTKKSYSTLSLFLKQFSSPIVLILLFSSIFSFILADKMNGSIIFIIVLFSAFLGFIQEKSAATIITELLHVVRTTIIVKRDQAQKNIPIDSLIPGDVICLQSGDMIPADCLLLEEKDLFIDESALTGESLPIEKKAEVIHESLTELKYPNLLFMGTHVISGVATALIITTGKTTLFGQISEKIEQKPPQSDYEKNFYHFGYFLIKTTFLFTFVIFLLNLYLKHSLLEALLFCLALAIGFTPQLLPAIITINLAKGSKFMAKKKVIVKKLSAIENFGSMNVLCCDKTGTLTEGIVTLYAALNVDGKEDKKVRLYATLNSSLQTGYPNPLDKAVLCNSTIDTSWKKLDEIPYDFVRKRLTIAVTKESETKLISKGSFLSILSICSKIHLPSQEVVDIDNFTPSLQSLFTTHSQKGYRILGLAYKDFDPKKALTKEDEKECIFFGFLLFYDPPKANIQEILPKLIQLGIHIKMITGDNHLVAMYIAEKSGFKNLQIITGDALDAINDAEAEKAVLETDIFAEMNPIQKERVLLLLKKQKDCIIGYLGDGLNDSIAFHVADVGVSVNSAPPFIKERADIVLLDKNLSVLLDGVKEGRKTFANTMKYILMATSSNFGNMLTISLSSLFLGFFPALPKQILLTNLLVDIAETTIPTDNVDIEMEDLPWKWNNKWLQKFMLAFGPISSVFDFLTFFGLLTFFRVSELQFQTTWFIESVLSAVAVTFFLRTRRLFYKSKPSSFLLYNGLTIMIITFFLPWIPIFSTLFSFVPLPFHLLLFAVIIVIGYLSTTEVVKYFFYKKYNPTKSTQNRIPNKKRSI